MKSLPKDNIVLGLVEYTSISAGINSLDTMVKTAPIKVLEAKPISLGRFITVFTGDLASVEESIYKGLEVEKDYIFDHFIIANLDMQIIPAILGLNKPYKLNAMAIVESKTVASAIVSADKACKTSDIHLRELRLANGLGGKSYFIILGELYNIQSAIEEAKSVLTDRECLLNLRIIPSPHESIKDFF